MNSTKVKRTEHYLFVYYAAFLGTILLETVYQVQKDVKQYKNKTPRSQLNPWRLAISKLSEVPPSSHILRKVQRQVSVRREFYNWGTTTEKALLLMKANLAFTIDRTQRRASSAEHQHWADSLWSLRYPGPCPCRDLQANTPPLELGMETH